MVVDTNLWLPFGQKVLFSPISLGKPDWENEVFPFFKPIGFGGICN